MKNIIRSIVFVAVAGGIIVLGGCSEKINQLKNAKESVTSGIEEGKQMINTGKELVQEKNGIVSGLKDAMKNGVVMKCVSDEDGWVTYTNGKNLRTEGIGEDSTKQVVLVLGDVTYMWEKGAEAGQKLDKKCLADFQKSMGVDATVDDTRYETGYDIKELEADEASGKAKCSPSTSVDFTLPANIDFIDQCQVMKKEMKNIKQQVPAMN